MLTACENRRRPVHVTFPSPRVRFIIENRFFQEYDRGSGEGGSMSLVNQLGITLKDFLPDDPSDGKFITDAGRGATTRPYTQLKAHAADKRLPLHSVAEQLPDEIHRS
jgi:hypothetical protein